MRIPALAAVVALAAVAGYLAFRSKEPDLPPVPPRVAPQGDLPFAFVDVAPSVGYLMRNRSGKAGAKEFILEAMPPGIAVGDFDADGFMDMYCPNGNDITGYDAKTQTFTLLPHAAAPRDALYMNDKGRRFVDRAKEAGVDDDLWSFGAVAGDVDNDGDTDLYLCNWGPNKLFLNRGDGTFEEVGERVGVRGDPRDWSTGAALFDYDRDGDLDLYVAQYADVYDLARQPKLTKVDASTGTITGRNCEWKTLHVYCGPLGLLPLNDVLFKNMLVETGSLAFRDVTREAGLWFELDANSRGQSSSGPYYAFQPIVWDMNGDGWLDFYVSNDSVSSVAWINQRDGTFRDAALEMGLAMSQSDFSTQASMGVAIGDLNGDGMQDLTVTNFSHDHHNVLLCTRTGPGQVFFQEIAHRSNLREETFSSLGWGAFAFDPDEDGDLDLFYGHGHVYPEVDLLPNQDTTYRQRNLLFLNTDPSGPKFRNVTPIAGPGLGIYKCTRAAVRIDYDNDGDLDIATTEMNDAPCLLRCDLDRARSGTHWLQVRLRGRPEARVPRDPAGAAVTVVAGGRRTTQVLVLGSSFLSSEDPRLHFGLGSSPRADSVEVLWPNGEVTKLPDVAGDRLLVVEYPG